MGSWGTRSLAQLVERIDVARPRCCGKTPHLVFTESSCCGLTMARAIASYLLKHSASARSASGAPDQWVVLHGKPNIDELFGCFVKECQW